MSRAKFVDPRELEGVRVVTKNISSIRISRPNTGSNTNAVSNIVLELPSILSSFDQSKVSIVSTANSVKNTGKNVTGGTPIAAGYEIQEDGTVRIHTQSKRKIQLRDEVVVTFGILVTNE